MIYRVERFFLPHIRAFSGVVVAHEIAQVMKRIFSWLPGKEAAKQGWALLETLTHKLATFRQEIESNNTCSRLRCSLDLLYNVENALRAFSTLYNKSLARGEAARASDMLLGKVQFEEKNWIV